MKKLILKTALITLGIALIIAASVFGIASFVAPDAMMRFFDSLGMESISGDYAYQQYQISKDIDYLARSFEIAAEHEKASVASERFDEFYGDEGSDQRTLFGDYCQQQTIRTEDAYLSGALLDVDYRSMVCGQAAVVKYRIAASDEDRQDVCNFAVNETDAELSTVCPIVALSAEVTAKCDYEFCGMLLKTIQNETKFNVQNATYLDIVKILEDASNE